MFTDQRPRRLKLLFYCKVCIDFVDFFTDTWTGIRRSGSSELVSHILHLFDQLAVDLVHELIHSILFVCLAHECDKLVQFIVEEGLLLLLRDVVVCPSELIFGSLEVSIELLLFLDTPIKQL